MGCSPNSGGPRDGVLGTVPSLGPASGWSSWKAAPLASRSGEEPNFEVLPLQLWPQPPPPTLRDLPPPANGGSELHELQFLLTLVFSGGRFPVSVSGSEKQSLVNWGPSFLQNGAPIKYVRTVHPSLPVLGSFSLSLPRVGLRWVSDSQKGPGAVRGAFGWMLVGETALG